MAKVEKLALLAEGKAKAVYATSDPELLWLHNLDQATALNGKKKESIANKAHYTNAISGLLFEYLKTQNIANHLVERLNDTDSLVQKLTMVPIEIVTRNYASGSFQRKYAVKPMKKLIPPVQEFYLKNDELDDPTLNDSQILALELANEQEIAQFKQIALEVNQALVNIFDQADLTLVDFKIEVGYTSDHKLLLADELSPDNMRIVDKATQMSLDKDVFRKGTGSITEVYEIVLQRLQAVV
ncbi:MAG: phosphoribosylaminoimidazolesuccinocarboxamide synthase [Lactobacillaceae bacterium]|jgi:phosphoribosylaminoimidazole-succinocarboxamide synthase|nr:phosphoribosylaminoimidazolesuccinocarboxamide synthase [Lactobacillaceae bacterium]